MSRKDPRACMLVPLTPADIDWLRTVARGRSLGDTVRRVAAAAQLSEIPVKIGPQDDRLLPVQLPRDLLAEVEMAARTQGCEPAKFLAALVAGARCIDLPQRN